MRTPAELSGKAIRLQFDRRAPRLDRDAFLLREIEARMLERVQYVRLDPARALDVGCATGAGMAALARHYPRAAVLGVDLSTRMVREAAQRFGQTPGAGIGARLRTMLGSLGATLAGSGPRVVQADAHALPFGDASFELLWSNLVLHWFQDPIGAIAEWRRVLHPGGLLMFSALGVDSLRELRAAGAQTMSFQDMHDIGDALLAAGFAEPVIDMETITLTFPTTQALVSELRALGGNALRARRAGLAGRRWLAAAHARLEAHSRRPAGDAQVLTFEVVYGHAWCPQPRSVPDGYAPVRIVPRSR